MRRRQKNMDASPRWGGCVVVVLVLMWWGKQASREETMQKTALWFGLWKILHVRRCYSIKSMEKDSDQWACLKKAIVHLTNWNVHIKERTNDLAGVYQKNKRFWKKRKFLPLATFKTAHLAWIFFLLLGFATSWVSWLNQKADKWQDNPLQKKLRARYMYFPEDTAVKLKHLQSFALNYSTSSGHAWDHTTYSDPSNCSHCSCESMRKKDDST